MLPKAHLTSHCRISGSRWVTTPSWLFLSLRPFLYSSSVYSCHLLLISSARSLPFLSYYAHPCMKCSLDLPSFLEEISSLSHSVVFLYFFALFIEESLLISPCYSLELCVQFAVHSLPLASLLSSAIWKASLYNYFAFLDFFFLGMVLVTTTCTDLWTSVHTSSGSLSTISNPLNLFITSTV